MVTAAVVNGISAENVIATVAVLTAVVVVTAAFAVDYRRSDSAGSGAEGEQASACAIQSALVPGTPLWAMGNPLPLVLLHRRNPDNYSYLGAGLDRWKVQHTKGGFAGWTAQVIRSRASVIVVDVWQSPMRLRMQAWLAHHGFVRGYIGPCRFSSPGRRWPRCPRKASH